MESLLMKESDNVLSPMFRNILTDNMDVMQTIIAYLTRKEKYLMQIMNKDFRKHIVPRAMVTLRFIG